jgi:hypothetical protein
MLLLLETFRLWALQSGRFEKSLERKRFYQGLPASSSVGIQVSGLSTSSFESISTALIRRPLGDYFSVWDLISTNVNPDKESD